MFSELTDQPQPYKNHRKTKDFCIFWLNDAFGQQLPQCALSVSFCSVPWGHLASILGSFRTILRPLGAVLGRLCAMLEPFEAILGHLGAVLGHLGAMLGLLGLSWIHLGAILGPFWGHLGVLGGAPGRPGELSRQQLSLTVHYGLRPETSRPND